MNSAMKQGSLTDSFRASRSGAGAARPTGKAAGKPASPPAPAPPAAAAAAGPSSAAQQQQEADEVALRQFDLDTKFGPCTGITRLQRWERAAKLGLSPPPEVPQLVGRYGADSPFNQNLFAPGKV